MSTQESVFPAHTDFNNPTTNGGFKATLDVNPFAPTNEYYAHEPAGPGVAKSRTYSAVTTPHPLSPQHVKKRWSFSQVEKLTRGANAQIDKSYDKNEFRAKRRMSQDDQGKPRRYLVNVKETLKSLLSQEDSDGNVQITIEDHGPKTMALGTAASGGYRRSDVRGTYMLSNLLQELTLADRLGRKQIVLDEARLNENPVDRLARLIKDQFWPNLTRKIDGTNIAMVARDPKDWTSDPRPRIYVPIGAPEQHAYYSYIAEKHPEYRLDVQWLQDPPGEDHFVRDLNAAPGLLAVAMKQVGTFDDGTPNLEGLPFVVPGGRFNELYGWDSYMETLGLLINDRVDLCEGMVKHFCFCVKHYGKILNANRSYYLCRSQPPFLTDMALRVYDRVKHKPESRDFLKDAMLAAIKDYYDTWTSEPRLDKVSGLSRYRPGGIGIPPETEADHFYHILKPMFEKRGMTFEEYVDAYNSQRIDEPELDEFLLHDRAVRESGHDTSYRLEQVAANLATVDLNSLLYKYEVDIARTIRNFFGDKLEIPAAWQAESIKRADGGSYFETSATWDRRARKRRQTMDKLMWSEEAGMFFDYDTQLRKQTGYESATTFWTMWAGACAPRQAAVMVERALPKFEVHGGLVAGTEKSRGEISMNRPNRQWDYPFGWAPQQILAWVGLQRYGFEEEAQRLAYRWVLMVTKAFVDFNGVVVEKYNVTRELDPHKVTAEYGNQGADFKGVATEGFGWVNASYVLGLQIVTAHMKRALGAVTPWETFQKVTVNGGGT